MSGCLFCRIVSGEIPSRRIYADETAVAFLDIAPWHRGHSLVIPRRHVEDGTSQPQAWQEISTGLTAVAGLLTRRLGAQGVNFLANCGAVAGQEVFHFHVHVVPRYADRPGIAGLATRDETAADDLDGLHRLLTGSAS